MPCTLIPMHPSTTASKIFWNDWPSKKRCGNCSKVILPTLSTQNTASIPPGFHNMEACLVSVAFCTRKMVNICTCSTLTMKQTNTPSAAYMPRDDLARLINETQSYMLNNNRLKIPTIMQSEGKPAWTVYIIICYVVLTEYLYQCKCRCSRLGRCRGDHFPYRTSHGMLVQYGINGKSRRCYWHRVDRPWYPQYLWQVAHKNELIWSATLLLT